MDWMVLALCVICLAVGSQARGFDVHIPKYKHNQTGTDSFNDVTKTDTKFSREENSVEKSSLLTDLDFQEEADNEVEPLFTRLSGDDLSEQLLVQLAELSRQVGGMRRSLANLKYQSHVQYKMLKRMQNNQRSAAACETAAYGNSPESNVIRTAAQHQPLLQHDEPPRPRQPLCPEEFEYNEETRSCYQFGTNRITWRMARERCLAQDADLVTIETQREQRYITDTARGRSDIRHCNFWTGATDQDSEGQWYWVANKKPLSYSFWNHNEPNNGSGDEHCMHMLWVFGWSWNDARCNYDSACYICEIHHKNKSYN